MLVVEPDTVMVAWSPAFTWLTWVLSTEAVHDVGAGRDDHDLGATSSTTELDADADDADDWPPTLRRRTAGEPVAPPSRTEPDDAPTRLARSTLTTSSSR